MLRKHLLLRRNVGYCAVTLAAFVPFANFAAVNAGEGIQLWYLCLSALTTAACGIVLTFTMGLFAHSGRERTAFAVSVFLLAFFCFSITQFLTGANGVSLLVIHCTATLLACMATWWLAKREGIRRYWLLTLVLMLVLSVGTYGVRTYSLNWTGASAYSAKPPSRARQEYRGLGTSVTILSANPTFAKLSDGDGILGVTYAPKDVGSVLHVHVVANAYSAQKVTGVVAVFRVGRASPVALQSKHISAGERAVFNVTFDVTADRRLPVAFVVRIGPTGPGTLLINGPNLASKPADIPSPYITVSEVKQKESRISAADRYNVYYLTLDSYPRADVLKEIFGFDNSEFIEALRSKGFLVATKSFANYFGTHLSVPAAMDQRYIVDESDTNFWNKMPWFMDVENGNNRVFRQFKELGYFVAKLNFWDLCPLDAFVDYCYLKKSSMNPWMRLGITDSELSLLQLTPLYEMLQLTNPDFFKSRIILEDMDDVMQLTARGIGRNPRFTYAHILLPHPPYRFEADCRWAKNIDLNGTDPNDDPPNPKKRFLDQVQCANRKVLRFVDWINKNDPNAIILINSDHGSGFSVDWSLPYDRWHDSAIRERFGNLDAMHLPARCRSSFYDAISPVNYFELVFSCIEKRAPKYLDDRIYISTYDKSHPRYGEVWRYR